MLAERALKAVLPEDANWPYVIRLVSDIMESNGSSSMASVCGGCLALMDAGVPIKAPVAGIAMGLIKEGEKIAILSDILGDEDHLGDMDFKVCGTDAGITSIQMDIKIGGVTREIMEKALNQAAAGRKHILAEMKKAIAGPARRRQQVRAAHHHHQDPAGVHQERHRPRRQGDQGHHRPHRLLHQRRRTTAPSPSPPPTRSRSRPPSR